MVGRVTLENALPTLRRTTAYSIRKLAADAQFQRALRAAAVTREMKEAQNEVAFDRYLKPALSICEAKGFVYPLSLAVVYDSVTHGSWEWISRTVSTPPRNEKAWIIDYVRKRHLWLSNIRRLRTTNYRTRFFLSLIAVGNWQLRLPVVAQGVRLTDAMLPVALANEEIPAAQNRNLPPVAGPLERAGDAISAAAGKFDRVDGIVTAVTSRRDAAKSLWTTIIGSLSQAAWAVFGFLVGLPKTVWIVVAVIAATLMLAYLYRQIELGKVREVLGRKN
jgi:hypothetical protein